MKSFTTEEIITGLFSLAKDFEGKNNDSFYLLNEAASRLRAAIDIHEILRHELKKASDRNSEFIDMQRNNIISTLGSTDTKTLRDEFAMAFISDNADWVDYIRMAKMAYVVADAMLEARKK